MDRDPSLVRTGMTRREFTVLAAASAAALVGSTLFPSRSQAQGAPMFPQPALLYPENALAPVISANTLSFHYGKHTKAYYDNTNKMLAEKPMAGMSLERVFMDAAKDAGAVALFNNSAQAWNHTFYFQCMKPGGGGAPTGKLADALNAAFGGFDAFIKTFTEAAVTQFGSGWAWLVDDGGTLKVVKTPNAMNPMVNNQKPLLTLDVWEHAYYLDYQNRRADYVKGYLEKLVNWDFAAKNLG